MTLLINGKSEIELDNIESNSIDALISDIPYGVNINPEWDKNLPSEEIWDKCYRVLKPGSFCILFGQPSMISDLMLIMVGTDFEYRDMLIWQYQGTHTKGYKHETEDGLFRSRIRNVVNPIFIYRKKIEGTEEENWLKYRTNLFNTDANREPYEGNHSNIIKKYKETGEKHLQSSTNSNTFKTMGRKGWVPDPRGREPVNIKYIPRATKAERTANGRIENKHETVKPVKLMLWLVNLVTSEPEQVVLDPFCGTGSTGCACELLDRKFIGIDCDQTSLNVANIRIEHIEEFRNKLL